MKDIPQHKPPGQRDHFWGERGALSQGEPVVYRACEIGPCCESWTTQYLQDSIGDRRVSVHVANTSQLNFSHRNFSYEQMEIGELLRKCSEPPNKLVTESGSPLVHHGHQWLYYRALGRRHMKDRAQLNDFGPQIADNFTLPPELGPPATCQSSSVLRISSPGIELWGHYDIPDNFLVQVRGTKRVRLFPPEQVANLYIKESSSPVLGLVDGDTVDFDKYPKAAIALSNSRTVDVGPGDILFIPSCWIHAISCLGNNLSCTNEPTLSVNVFFWNEELVDKKLYDTKDIYGNKDLMPFQKLENSLDKEFIPALLSMPRSFRDLYIKKIIAKMESVDN